MLPEIAPGFICLNLGIIQSVYVTSLYILYDTSSASNSLETLTLALPLLTWLVDLLFPPTRVFSFWQFYTNIGRTRNGTKAKTERNSEWSINTGTAALPGLSRSGPEALHWV
jgi:hypothetical protein